MNGINGERLFQTFSELVSIDSVSFRERKMADALKERLRELGLTVIEDDTGERTGSEAGNLYAFTDPAGKENVPSVLFSAHMDTVEPGTGKQAVLSRDGKITGNGKSVLGADDVSAIAGILEALREILEEGGDHRNIEILFTTAEEAYAVGADAFDISRIRAKTAYFPDRTGDIGSVSISEPSLISFEVTVEGKSSHAGFAPEEGINAIVTASKAIARLPVGRVNENTTLAIGLIEGGTAPNIVPDLVRIKGEIRSRTDKEALSVLDSVREAFETEAAKTGGRCDLTFRQHLYAYEVGEDSEALSEYERVLREKGIPLQKEKSFGGSDSNPFRKKGIDALCIANAMHDIHSVDEYTTLSEMMEVTDIIKKLMRG